jgi:hypothetical protein
MAKDFVWHYDAAGDVFLRSDGIAQACEAAAARMTRATGMEYQFETGRTSQRVIVEGRGEGDDE